MVFKPYSDMIYGLVIKVLRWVFLDCSVLLQINFLGWVIMVFGGAMTGGGKSFGGELIRRRLPTNDELFKRNIIVRVDEMMCIFCNNHVETIDHLFTSCDFVASIWKGFYSWLQILLQIIAQFWTPLSFMNPSEVVVVQSCGECFGSQ
ncbi:hypothetical protein Lal_00046239 [Lupinus albus]|nr:hypothetical protein Lal_00046239 [Lupinus albus]